MNDLKIGQKRTISESEAKRLTGQKNPSWRTPITVRKGAGLYEVTSQSSAPYQLTGVQLSTMKNNYIQSLQSERAALKAQIATAQAEVTRLMTMLESPKYTTGDDTSIQAREMSNYLRELRMKLL